MRVIQEAVLLLVVVSVAFLLPAKVTAQNPSFAGKEFKKIWSDADTPQGANGSPRIVGSSDLYLTSAGVFLDSRTYEVGMYYFDDSGAYTVATKAQPEFSSAGFFSFIGAQPDGSMLIWPVANNNIYFCQVYDSNGLSAIASPTPAQALNQGNYFAGRFVYLEHAGLGAVNIWYYSEGSPAALWLDNTDFADLATILDYDGTSLAFAEGTTGDFDVWLRESGGTLTHIIGEGDPMPGAAGTTFTGDPVGVNTEVDQGRVYVQGVSSGGDTVLFSSTDGATFDIIAKVGQVVPGLATTTISGMALKQVRDGKIWLQVTQSNGDTVLYQIGGGTWSRVAGKNDSYDGRVPISFGAYEHGSLGDSVAVVVQYLNFSSPTIYDTEIYVNADLPGFSAGPSGLVMGIASALGGNLSVMATGAPGETNTLQATSSLTNMVWDTVGPVVADGAGLMEWTVNPTNGARYFRLVE